MRTMTQPTLASRRPRPNRALIEARLDQFLTPPTLALRAGVSANTVRSAEAGRYIEPRSQGAIANALRCERRELFPFECQREAMR